VSDAALILGGTFAACLVALAIGIGAHLEQDAQAAPLSSAPIVCLFDCAENEEGCTNDSYCLGPCVCDLDLEECVPE
jgi:hypothetical protein